MYTAFNSPVINSQTPFDRALAAANFLKQQSKRTGVVLLQPDESLEIYKYFKQGTVGNINVAKPGFFDFVGKYKYAAWESLRGMPMEEARRLYCEVIKKYMVKYGYQQHIAGF